MKKLLYIVGTNSKCSGGYIDVAEIVNVVCVNFDEAGEKPLTFETMCNLNGMALYGMLSSGAIGMNFKVVDGRYKGRNASLSRFAGHTPLVVVSKVMIKGINDVIGYNVADSKGKVSRVKKSVLLDFCKSSGQSIPIQNMQWVADGANGEFLREYSDDKFAIEFIGGIQTTKVKEPEKVEKKEVSKEKQIYTQEQQDEIDSAIANGVDASIIANAKLSPARMRNIWQAEKRGIPARKLNNPELDIKCMTLLMAEMEMGNNVDFMIDNKYDVKQITELILARDSGLDLRQMEGLNAEEMYQKRIRMENEVWVDNFSSRIG